jgi:hypothetical protein
MCLSKAGHMLASKAPHCHLSIEDTAVLDYCVKRYGEAAMLRGDDDLGVRLESAHLSCHTTARLALEVPVRDSSLSRKPRCEALHPALRVPDIVLMAPKRFPRLDSRWLRALQLVHMVQRAVPLSDGKGRFNRTMYVLLCCAHCLHDALSVCKLGGDAARKCAPGSMGACRFDPRQDDRLKLVPIVENVCRSRRSCQMSAFDQDRLGTDAVQLSARPPHLIHATQVALCPAEKASCLWHVRCHHRREGQKLPSDRAKAVVAAGQRRPAGRHEHGVDDHMQYGGGVRTQSVTHHAYRLRVWQHAGLDNRDRKVRQHAVQLGGDELWRWDVDGLDADWWIGATAAVSAGTCVGAQAVRPGCVPVF